MSAHLKWLPVILAFASPVATVAQEKEPAPAQEMITKEARQAIDHGLAYLAKQQDEEGAWGTGFSRQYTKNVAISSLAGLAFLSAGHRPGKEPYGPVIAKAVDYVLKCGGTRHLGMPPGFFLQNQSMAGPMYNHAYAVLFLAEAHGVLEGTKKEEVNEALRWAVKIIVNSQNKQGGWRYRPEARDADLSVTGCQIHALVAATKAGVRVPEETLDKAVGYLRTCRNLKDGGFQYQPQWGKSTYALTAVALSALAAVGAGEDEAWTKGLAFLRSQRGANIGRDTSHHNYFYHGNYYAAAALKQVGGKDWPEWYGAIRDALLKPTISQVNTFTRHEDGRWSGGISCPHHCTALAVLIVQMPDSRLVGGKR